MMRKQSIQSTHSATQTPLSIHSTQSIHHIDPSTTTITPRFIYDSSKVQSREEAIAISTTDYEDQSGHHELCTTYRTIFQNDTPVLDWPPRDTLLFRSFLVDWVVLASLLGLIALWWAPPPKFYFRLDDPYISYPKVEDTVSSTAITITIILGPIGIVTIAQIWVRSFRDWHQSVLSTLELFAVTQVICTAMWCLVGGLRPNFLATCLPDTSLGTPIFSVPSNPSIGHVYYGDEICTCSKGELIRGKHAFPSGHAASIVAVCFFLAIYLCAKMKLYDGRSHLWKFVVVIGLFIVATWISFSRIRDGKHHFRDIVVGMIIGAIVAPLIYRLNFCSLFGPDNHLPTRYTWRGRFFPPSIPPNQRRNFFRDLRRLWREERETHLRNKTDLVNPSIISSNSGKKVEDITSHGENIDSINNINNIQSVENINNLEEIQNIQNANNVNNAHNSISEDKETPAGNAAV